MQHLRITTPADLTDQVVDVFTGDPAVSQLAVMRGASIEPAGDLVLADVAREAVNEIVERLDALGIPESGSIHIEPVTTWVSRAGLDAERARPAPAPMRWCGPTSPSAPTRSPSSTGPTWRS